MVTDKDSPLAKPPRTFSRRQTYCADGIRIAADIAEIAHDRLWSTLEPLTVESRPTPTLIAEVAMDAWTIVDSVHRARDLLLEIPGLKRAPWMRVFEDEVEQTLKLRDLVQHQVESLRSLSGLRTPLWGTVAWFELRDGHYTGHMGGIALGNLYSGDRIWFLPANTPPSRAGRIHLSAFGARIHLGSIVNALRTAVAHLESTIRDGEIREDRLGEIEDPADRDVLAWGFVEVMRADPRYLPDDGPGS